MAGKQSRYHSYLLRLWRVNEEEQTAWRGSLENPHTGERLSFASPERLFAYLQDQLSGAVSGDLTESGKENADTGTNILPTGVCENKGSEG